MAEAVKLPNSKTKLVKPSPFMDVCVYSLSSLLLCQCVEQAKELSKRQAVGGKGLSLNNVSAA